LTGLVDVNGNPIDLNTNVDNYVLLASGVVTANGNSFDVPNPRCRGVKVYITTGAFGSGASAITVTIQGKDPVSGKYYTILTSASLVTNKDISNAAANLLTVYPELAAVANQTAQDVLPPTWRISYQASAWGSGGSTLGIACAMIV
jgi:hypothetical protein